MQTSGSYSFGAAFGAGLDLFKTRYGLVLGVSLVVMAVSALPGIVTTPINLMTMQNGGGGSPALPLIQLLGSCFSIIWSLLVATPISIGGLWVMVRAVRGGREAEAVEFMDILAPFRRIGWVIVAQLLFSAILVTAVFVVIVILLVVAMVLGLVIGLTVGNDEQVAAAIGIGAMLLGIPLIVVLVYYPMVRIMGMMVLVVDEGRGHPNAVDALTQAWNGTRGHGWSLVLLAILSGLLIPASLLLCGIGIFLVGIPLYSTIIAAAYALLFPRHEADRLQSSAS